MKWFKYARRLSNIRRCGTLRMIHSQNVAEHSFYAAILAMEIMRELDARNFEGIDHGEVLEKVLLHDLEETITGDMPYPFKRSSKSMAEKISAAKDTLVKEFYPPWMAQKNIEAKKYPLGPIVVAADYLELHAYCLEEKWLGNREPYLDEILEECRKIVNRQTESQGIVEAEVGAIAMAMMADMEISFFRTESKINERMMINE